MDTLPKSQDLLLPVLTCLGKGSGPLSNRDISTHVSQALNLGPELISLIHSGTRTELEYRLAWARTKAKSRGWIKSEKRESWEITDSGREYLKTI